MNGIGKFSRRSILKVFAWVTLTTTLGLTIAKQPAQGWTPRVRPDLNGLRLKGSGPEQYLVDRGYRRWIPDIATRDRLFRDDRYQAFDVQAIAEGQAISANAILVRAEGRQEVFLLDAGVKRWITSPAVMDRYGFSWDNIQQVSPPILLDYVPAGDPIY
jgi:hypothetical protein